MAALKLIIARAARPFPGEVESGDWCCVDWDDGTCRIAVVDGLGHGPLAAAAAVAACQALASRPDLAPRPAIELCDRALKGTRGAAIFVVTVEPLERQAVYLGIGNVEARLWQPGGERHLASARGIVGQVLPRAAPITESLGPDWLLLIHSDGVSGRFVLGSIAAEAGWDPQSLADLVLARHGRTTDDATVVVVTPDNSG